MPVTPISFPSVPGPADPGVLTAGWTGSSMSPFALALALVVSGCSGEESRRNSAGFLELSPQAARDALRADDPSPSGLVEVPAGSFLLGAETHNPAEGPPHRVEVEAFWIEVREVTNLQFQAFVEATNFVTDAERIGNAVVFTPPSGGAPGEWGIVDDADWRHPEGPDSSLEGRWTHPVVQVSLEDARAYAKWIGRRLPTEAEWEWAARGGRLDALYPWGNHYDEAAGLMYANVWQGPFPIRDDARDGFTGTSPVGQYSPTPIGLFDVAGNAWEWTDTPYVPGFGLKDLPPAHEPGTPEPYVIRGGSWLCAESWCSGYRLSARQFNQPTESGTHVGFRCVSEAPPEEGRSGD